MKQRCAPFLAGRTHDDIEHINADPNGNSRKFGLTNHRYSPLNFTIFIFPSKMSRKVPSAMSTTIVRLPQVFFFFNRKF